MSQSPAFATAATHNQLMNCNARGCRLSRKGINAWCSSHLEQARRLGHPSAQPYRPSTWRIERNEVAAVFAAHPDHDGVRQVLDWLAAWMARACGSERAFKGARDVARLARHGVAPLQMLTEVAAFVVWEQANAHAFPDQRSRDFGLSRAVFALAPRLRRACAVRGSIGGTWGQPTSGPRSYAVRPQTSGLAFVGKHLREAFSPLLAQVQHAVERRRVLKVDPEANLRLPFRQALTFT